MVTLGGTLTAEAGNMVDSGTTATAIAGGLTAAAANVASQAVGIVAGVQDGLNWKSVGTAALGGAVGAAFGALTGNLSSSSLVNAGLSNIATQAVLIAAHQQEKFNWTSIAFAAVSGAIGSSAALNGLQESMKSDGWSAFAQGAVKSGISGFLGALITDLIVPGKQDWAQIGIATVQSALESGLADQRQYELAYRASLGEDASWRKPKTYGSDLPDTYVNADASINEGNDGFIDLGDGGVRLPGGRIAKDAFGNASWKSLAQANLGGSESQSSGAGAGGYRWGMESYVGSEEANLNAVGPSPGNTRNRSRYDLCFPMVSRWPGKLIETV